MPLYELGAVSHFSTAKARGQKSQSHSGMETTSFELPKLYSLCWDDAEIEAGAATSAWAEEVRKEVEKC